MIMMRLLGLDVLVNNAGFLVFGEASWQTSDQVDRQVKVNMTGPLQVKLKKLVIFVYCKVESLEFVFSFLFRLSLNNSYL